MRKQTVIATVLVSLVLGIVLVGGFQVSKELKEARQELDAAKAELKVLQEEQKTLQEELQLEQEKVIILQNQNKALTKQAEEDRKSIEALEKEKAELGKKLEAATVFKETIMPSRGSSGTKEYVMHATAYTAYCNGCSGLTAWREINLRANPNAKVIAVDPNVIPLGSKVWVEGYGYAVAADKGGDIKGYRIDVFIPDLQNAKNFGNKTVRVKVLGS